MLAFTFVACEGDNDGTNSGVNNERPGKLPNENVDGTPDDDMGKPNEDIGDNNNDGTDDGGNNNGGTDDGNNNDGTDDGGTDDGGTDDGGTDDGGTDDCGTDDGGTDDGGTDDGGTDDGNNNGGTNDGGTDDGGTNDGGTDDGGTNDGGTNDGGNDEVLDATYVFKDNLLGILRVVDGDLRNDYVEFLDNTTGHALYIDFYSPLGGEYLPTGTYPLGDGSSMTSLKKYTYILLSGWSDFIYITEGYAEVVATRDETTGEIVHKITADYTMSTGDTIALRYSGVLELREM